jgi:hypothetical protein
MTIRALVSRVLATARCVLFHRRHRVTRIVGLFDCEVECVKCGRRWIVN